MSLISLLLNLLWIVFGGLWMALGWVIAAVVMAITIVGLPWARAAFSIATYTLLPFGYKAVPRDEYFGREDVGTARWGRSATSCGCFSPDGGWRSATSSRRSCLL